MQLKFNYKNFIFFLIILFFLYLINVLWNNDDCLPDLEIDLKDLISYAVLAVELGGQAVVKIRNEGNLMIEAKENTESGYEQKITRADLVSNQLILGLLKRFTLLKVITEEKKSISDAEVKKYQKDSYKIWLKNHKALEKFPSKKLNLNSITIWIDSLDATQEYIEGLTDYVSVMSCIAVDGIPTFGAIHRPFQNEFVLGLDGFGLIDLNGQPIKIKPENETKKNILVSRSHTGKVKEIAKNVFKKQNFTVVEAGGAGYKSSQLVLGNATMYIHTTNINKWDICAGDAIIHAAGGELVDFKGLRLQYNANSSEIHKGGFLTSLRTTFTFLSEFQDF